MALLDWIWLLVPAVVILIAIAYVYRPGARRKYEQASRIPLQDREGPKERGPTKSRR
jgi:cbb3-type cytochrome oxidase subunit 3